MYIYKEKYDFSYSFKTYIFTLGKNKAIDFTRKQSKLSFNSYEEELEMKSDYKTIEDKIINDEENKEEESYVLFNDNEGILIQDNPKSYIDVFGNKYSIEEIKEIIDRRR